LGIDTENYFTTSVTRENLHVSVYRTNQREQFSMSYIEDHHREAGINYAATRTKVENIYLFRTNKGVDNHIYHAYHRHEERNTKKREFVLGAGKIAVATIAFGM